MVEIFDFSDDIYLQGSFTFIAIFKVCSYTLSLIKRRMIYHD